MNDSGFKLRTFHGDAPSALDEMAPQLLALDAGIAALRASIDALLTTPVTSFTPSTATMGTFNWIQSQLATNTSRLIAIRTALATFTSSASVSGATSSETSLTFRNDQLIAQAARISRIMGTTDVSAEVNSLNNAVVALTEMIGRLETMVAGLPDVTITPVTSAEEPTNVVPYVLIGAGVLAALVVVFAD